MLAAIGVVGGSAHAVPVTVTVTGTVEYNQVTSGFLGNVNPGDSVSMTLVVDSESFVDSGSFPTRGYPISTSDFVLSFPTGDLPLQQPFPLGQTPYFTIRDNDPAGTVAVAASHRSENSAQNPRY